MQHLSICIHLDTKRVFVPMDLQTSKYVVVRVDTVKRLLQHPYDAPFEVLELSDNYMELHYKRRKNCFQNLNGH